MNGNFRKKQLLILYLQSEVFWRDLTIKDSGNNIRLNNDSSMYLICQAYTADSVYGYETGNRMDNV
jgi:hypothetical protein